MAKQRARSTQKTSMFQHFVKYAFVQNGHLAKFGCPTVNRRIEISKALNRNPKEKLFIVYVRTGISLIFSLLRLS